ncbi:MAG TPA: hypothetical protein PLH90_01860, partial [Candidatus Paceibacterota bacterium]|nr:hypothetical protein [Candidatus Paceibacterota bacterium]
LAFGQAKNFAYSFVEAILVVADIIPPRFKDYCPKKHGYFFAKKFLCSRQSRSAMFFETTIFFARRRANTKGRIFFALTTQLHDRE